MANATLDFSGLTVNRTFTYPDATGTVALTTGSSSIVTVGTVTTGTWNATKIGLAYGGTNADLSGTGGTSQVLKQTTVGGNITVAQLALADLSDGNTVALLAGATFTGDVKIGTVGKGLYVKEGVNATMGTLTLNGTTGVVVSTTKVTANSRIFLTHQATGGTPGFCYVDTRTASTSFTVKGTAGDTSTVAWLIVEPA